MRALVLYTDVGGGFKSPAVAVAKELEALGVSVRIVAVPAELGSPGLGKFIKDGWDFSLRNPLFFKMVYALFDMPILRWPPAYFSLEFLFLRNAKKNLGRTDPN